MITQKLCMLQLLATTFLSSTPNLLKKTVHFIHIIKKNGGKICCAIIIANNPVILSKQFCRSNVVNNRTILTVFLCCFDDEEDGTAGFATVTFTLTAGTFSFLPSGSPENNFLTSLFCCRTKL